MSRESFTDDLYRLTKLSNDISEYERTSGSDDFSQTVRGALHAQHTGNTTEAGSGYPRRYPK
ncbi:hypothetical protein [Streptomyces sp. P17]|uniref:hypothetical protein n=1 Tax=Streptomyces sp. P17 TaxID=3074716 RepID=UPI0028F3F8FD|nr:hypothetical protein [Streptomyces sp. P17]MDT9699290.1 hypothetical protein [Streptomyces sp. P17]